jgi:hypothetical protein
MPAWLRQTDVPLFVSTRRLSHRRKLPRARGRVVIDSAGYSELSLYGEWRTTPRRYVQDVRRYAAEIGRVEWAAPQDWMCEPNVRVKTGKTILEHQTLTIASVLELRRLAPEIPWAPVLQGYVLEDYLRHVDDYARVGIDLAAEPIIGVGTVCRRQATDEVVEILENLAGLGLRLHGFGIKKQGVLRLSEYLTSADSMAWSFDARRMQRAVCGSRTHKNCANCLRFALRWRSDLLKFLLSFQQLSLWSEQPAQLTLF